MAVGWGVRLYVVSSPSGPPHILAGGQHPPADVSPSALNPMDQQCPLDCPVCRRWTETEPPSSRGRVGEPSPHRREFLGEDAPPNHSLDKSNNKVTYKRNHALILNNTVSLVLWSKPCVKHVLSADRLKPIMWKTTRHMNSILNRLLILYQSLPSEISFERVLTLSLFFWLRMWPS